MKDMTSQLLRALTTILLSTTLVLSSASAAPLDAVYYFHNDHLGTPQVLTDAQGDIAWQGHYRPFGEADITVAKVENPLRFPGQYFDTDTGLHYNYFRDYDPGTGRYVQSDPIGLYDGPNTYAYAYADPIRTIDPYGLWGNILVAGGIRVVGGRVVTAAIGDSIRRNVPGVAGNLLACLAIGYCSESEDEESPVDSEDAQAPGCPTEDDGFIPKKKWDGKKVKNPHGPGYGYPDRKGNVWVPTGPGPNAHGGPHWDVQRPSGGYINVYPGGKTRPGRN